MRTLLSALILAVSVSASAGPCAFVEWDEYQGTKLLRANESTYAFATTKVKVDADGAPNAYHPDDVSLHCTRGEGFKGLDCPANAGYPSSSWWRNALLADPADRSRAYVQPAGSEFAGFFVSQTTLRDASKADTDPRKYVDSRTVPYLVFPGQFSRKQGTGSMGDLGYAVNLDNGKRSAFVVAEVGPSTADLGEMSIALAEAMGGTRPNPRTGAGAPRGKIAYVIFPGSRRAHRWPLTVEQMATQAEALLGEVGGVDGVVACRGEF